MKYLISLNLLLALFFGFQTTLLYQEIESMKVAKNMDPVYFFEEIVRQPVGLPQKWQNIFGTLHAEAKVDVAPLESPFLDNDDSSKPFHGKIRLRGIFIYNDMRKAVISIRSVKDKEKQTDHPKLISCKTGDTIDGFVVTRILPDRIVLKSRTSEPVTITIYKPLKVNGKND